MLFMLQNNEKQCFEEHSLNAEITYQVDHDKSAQLKGYFASLPLNISKKVLSMI